jgi:hypothetical protein
VRRRTRMTMMMRKRAKITDLFQFMIYVYRWLNE